MATNTLRKDPQRLGLLRRQFLGDVRKQFATTKSAVWQNVVTEDSFGLQDVKPLSMNTQWKYLSLDQQVEKFDEWLRGVFAAGILRRSPDGTPWFAKYVLDAYIRGATRSYSDTHKMRRFVTPGPYATQERQFLLMFRSSATGRAKEKIVVTRAAAQVDGLLNTSLQNMPRIISLGLTRRVRPQVLATAIINEITGTKTPQGKLTANAKKKKGTDARASRIVNTETSHAFTEGQLDALDEMGLEDVEIMAEWVTADDPCPECEELEGSRWRLEDAYGVIPKHPNCKCAFVAVDAEDNTWITPEWFT